MDIEARFKDKMPQTIKSVERLVITVGEFEIEVVQYPTDGKPALYIRCDKPTGDSLAVFPYAGNSIVLAPRRP